MLALLAAAAVLSSPPPARPAAAPGSGAGEVEPYTAKEMAWQKANLDTQGWTLVTVGGDVLIFLGSAPRAADGDPMIAVRGEHYPFAQTNSIGGGESFLSRDEIDCTKTMERTVSSTVYKDSGLQGNIASASDDPGPWRAIKDATFLAAAYKALCPGGSAAR